MVVQDKGCGIAATSKVLAMLLVILPEPATYIL